MCQNYICATDIINSRHVQLEKAGTEQFLQTQKLTNHTISHLTIPFSYSHLQLQDIAAKFEMTDSNTALSPTEQPAKWRLTWGSRACATGLLAGADFISRLFCRLRRHLKHHLPPISIHHQHSLGSRCCCFGQGPTLVLHLQCCGLYIGDQRLEAYHLWLGFLILGVPHWDFCSTVIMIHFLICLAVSAGRCQRFGVVGGQRQHGVRHWRGCICVVDGGGCGGDDGGGGFHLFHLSWCDGCSDLAATFTGDSGVGDLTGGDFVHGVTVDTGWAFNSCSHLGSASTLVTGV